MNRFSGSITGSRPASGDPWLVQLGIGISLAALAFCLIAWPVYPVLKSVGYGAAAALVAFSMRVMVRGGVVLFPELWLWLGFCAWALATGSLVAEYSLLFRDGAELLWQVTFVVLFSTVTAVSSGSPSSQLLSGILVALAFALSSLSGASFSLADQQASERESGLARNANALGIMCVWGSAGLAYFWQQTRNYWWRSVIVASALPLLWAILASGSRKSLLCLLLFVVCWLVLRLRGSSTQNLSAVFGLLILGVFLVVVAPPLLENTLIGNRLRAVAEGKMAQSDVINRLSLYEDGLRILMSAPVTGVGLGHYRVSALTGQHSHSDAIEVLSTTGLVGGALYFAMLLLWGRRLWRVLRLSPSSTDQQTAAVGLALWVTYLAFGLGGVLHLSMSTWCVFSGVLGFAYAAERRLRVIRRSRGPVRLLPEKRISKRGQVLRTEAP